MSDSLSQIPQQLLDSAQKVLVTKKQQLRIDQRTLDLLLISLKRTPILNEKLVSSVSSTTQAETAKASLLMAQACLIGLTLADSVKHLVGLGESKDAAGRETYSLGDTISSLVLSSLVKEYFPTYGILDEESGGYNLSGRRIITIDPIDGSISFTRGIDEGWAVGMALYDATVVDETHSGIIASAIALPQVQTQQQLVLGIPGSGCWNLAGETIHVSKSQYVQNDVRRCVVSIGHKDLRADVWDAGIKKLALHAQRLYAGIDIQHAGAMTARGQLDALIRAKQLSYDLAPIIGVVEAAGGKVLNFQGKTPKIHLDLITEQHIIAWNGDEELEKYLQELLES